MSGVILPDWSLIPERCLVDAMLSRCRHPALQRVIGHISYLSGIYVDQLIGPGRTRPLPRWRGLLCTAAYDILGMSYPEIGFHLECSHSTIITAVHRWRRERLRAELLPMRNRLIADPAHAQAVLWDMLCSSDERRVA